MGGVPRLTDRECPTSHGRARTWCPPAAVSQWRGTQGASGPEGLGLSLPAGDTVRCGIGGRVQDLALPSPRGEQGGSPVRPSGGRSGWSPVHTHGGRPELEPTGSTVSSNKFAALAVEEWLPPNDDSSAETEGGCRETRAQPVGLARRSDGMLLSSQSDGRREAFADTLLSGAAGRTWPRRQRRKLHGSMAAHASFLQYFFRRSRAVKPSCWVRGGLRGLLIFRPPTIYGCAPR